MAQLHASQIFLCKVTQVPDALCTEKLVRTRTTTKARDLVPCFCFAYLANFPNIFTGSIPKSPLLNSIILLFIDVDFLLL